MFESIWCLGNFAEGLENFESDKSFQELMGRVFIEGRQTVPDVSITSGILHRWMRFIRSTARISLLKNILKN